LNIIFYRLNRVADLLPIEFPIKENSSNRVKYHS
jgi:hypothetical protein